MCSHEFPPSMDLYTPLPTMTLLRRPSEPVPTYTMFASFCATAMSPIEGESKYPSETTRHVVP